LTLFFKEVVTRFFKEPIVPGSDDHIMKELLVTVINRILLRLQDQKLTEKELEEIGFMLRRTWFIGQAYAARKKELTLEQWLAKLKNEAEGAGISLL
jgi:hypothetical protein